MFTSNPPHLDADTSDVVSLSMSGVFSRVDLPATGHVRPTVRGESSSVVSGGVATATRR